MTTIHIKASPKQLSKIRNGHKVRISPAMEGMGCNLIVHPDRLHSISKTFSRGKGTQIQLTPDEIAVNQQASPSMKGTGIFGNKFDNFLDKNGLKKVAYKLGDVVKPAVKALLLGGLASGATALAGTETIASGGLGASAIPLIYGTAGSLGALGMDYLDNPRKYQDQPRGPISRSNAGGPKNSIASFNLEGEAVKNHLLNNISQEVGNQYNSLANATLDNAIANNERLRSQSAGLMDLKTNYNMGADGKGTRKPSVVQQIEEPAVGGYGYGIKGGSIHRERASVGTNGGFISTTGHIPPAMMSQPFGTNFQFQHTLPPAYQKFSSG